MAPIKFRDISSLVHRRSNELLDNSNQSSTREWGDSSPPGSLKRASMGRIRAALKPGSLVLIIELSSSKEEGGSVRVA